MADKKKSNWDEDNKVDENPPERSSAEMKRDAPAEMPKRDVPVETPKVEEKDLSRVNMDQAEESGIQTYGNPGAWHTLCKAWNKKEGWMKTTKAMQAGAAGCLIQVTTQQRNPDGTWTLAEAVCFAVRVNLVVEGGKARLE